MERADIASSSGAERDPKVVNDEGKVGGNGMAAVSGKLKVVRVKRKREQAPIENLCKLDSHAEP